VSAASGVRTSARGSPRRSSSCRRSRPTSRVRHDVRAKSEGEKRFAHPLVGPLELRYESFTVNGADGQLLIVYHAEPAALPSEASRFCRP